MLLCHEGRTQINVRFRHREGFLNVKAGVQQHSHILITFWLKREGNLLSFECMKAPADHWSRSVAAVASGSQPEVDRESVRPHKKKQKSWGHCELKLNQPWQYHTVENLFCVCSKEKMTAASTKSHSDKKIIIMRPFFHVRAPDLFLWLQEVSSSKSAFFCQSLFVRWVSS